MSRLLLLVLLVAACGWPPPPETVSIDPAFDEGERVAIDDGLDQWCAAVGWCPRIVERGAEGRIEASESTDDGVTTMVDGKTVVRLNRGNLRLWGGVAFWTVAAHEMGHFGAEHTPDGVPSLMTDYFDDPSLGSACIDEAATRLWCKAQGCSHTRGTCG